MADESDNLVLRMLRSLHQKIDKLDLKITDLTANMQQIQTDLGALRGTVSAMRHDVTVYGNRWADLEVRTRALEDESPLNH